MHDVRVDDRRLAAVVRACLNLPGQQLFQYLDLATVAHLDGRLDGDAAGYAAAIAGTAHAGPAVASDILRTRVASLARTRGRAEEATA